MTTEPTDTRRVELRVRERTPAPVLETIDDVSARLRRLEAEGTIDEFRVESWFTEPAGVDETADTVVERYRSWAEDAGYALEPAFCRREVTSMLSGTPHTKLVVPFVTVAVYDGEQLECVTPCMDGERVVTVDDCLRALEAGAADPLAAARDPVDDADGSERPVNLA